MLVAGLALVLGACGGGGGGGGGGGTPPAPTNRAPIAAAGADQAATVGAQVTLNGSNSSDPDGDALTYSWSFSARPAGSAASLAGATTATPRFTPDVGGRYTVTLTASDGRLQDTDSVSVDANTRPVAAAGANRAVDAGTTVTLDGSGSGDADGDTLSFSWALTRPVGSQATLSDATSVRPLFVADLPGTYVATLTVNDGSLDSASDSATITAAVTNLPPTADAGADTSVVVGQAVTLDGTGSADADGDSLTYTWTLTAPGGSAAEFDDPSSPTPSFTPDVAGTTFTATLVVNDGRSGSAPDTVDVTALPLPANNLPSADAGVPQSVATGTTVQLDGSGSIDPDGDPLSFAWKLAKPTNSAAQFLDATSRSPTFEADVAGIYTASLVVNDGQGNSPVDTVTITVAAPGVNTPPIADAGSPVTVDVGQQVVLDGGASSDADGDALTFAWILSTPDGSGAILNGPNGETPDFTPDVAGTYTATLIVDDGAAASAPDSVVVTAKAPQSNTPPVAHAGPDLTGNTGDTVLLDGTSSEDLDGNILTYEWTLSLPEGSAAVLDDAISATPTFVADVPGTYTATLRVDDGTDLSAPDSVTIVITDPEIDTRPVADAGEDMQVTEGARVTLDGRGSFDADGDPLTYTWSLSRPDGSQATLSDPASPLPTFLADVPGLYVATLLVNDGELVSSPDSVGVTALAAPVNTPPVADADGDQAVQAGDLVQLDGTASSDADADILTYNWSLNAPVGSTAVLSDAAIASPTFTADQPGQYVATLVVNDGTEDSAPDSVVVTVAALPVNMPPVADAGGNQSVETGANVQLDGSASSDADGDPFTYLWTLDAPATSTATLSDPTASAPNFVADLAGSYTATLVVNDGQADSAPDSAVIDVTAPAVNQPPVADAGPDQAAVTGSQVALDGSGSTDPEGDPLSFTWTLSGPAGSGSGLSDTSSATPTFVPDVAGPYTATLVVGDGESNSSPDSVIITVTDPPTNTPPVADAGADQAVETGSPVILDGTGSFDADGDPITYSWTLQAPAGSGASLSAPTSAAPEFTPDVAGQYVAVLVVNDSMEDSAADSVTVTASAPPMNTAPVANAGADQTGEVGQAITLDGSSSADADGDPLTYSWTLTKPVGSQSTLLGATTVGPQFIPDVDGTYTATLIVNDGKTGSEPDAVSVSVAAANTPPIADAGPDASGLTGDLIVLDGSNSSDADGDPLTYQWLLARPAGSVAQLSAAATPSPSFTADVAGTYTATLRVDDGTDESAPDSVTILVSEPAQNARPLADAGADFSASFGATVQLDGSGSSDPDGDPLTYAWALSRPAGSSAVLSDGSSVRPTFVVDEPGVYTATLTVSDGALLSAPDTVSVTVLNGRPTAVAGEDQAVNVGAIVVVDGSASSDPEDQVLTYAWELATPEGSSATLTGADTASPQFKADVAGVFAVTLTVNDGTNDSLPDTVNVFVNGPPVADAGADREVVTGNVVQLDGTSSSDPDGDALSYLWKLEQVPSGSAAALSSPSSATPNFVPDVAGVYTVTLTVSDGGAQDADSLIVTANTPPQADAGLNQQVTTGTPVTLDGSASADADGDPITYLWELSTEPAGSSASLSDPTSIGPTFTPDVGGIYIVTLTVSDGRLEDTDTVTVDVNTIPVADAGSDRAADVGALVVLDGSSSTDADGDALNYSWTFQRPTGSSAVLSNPASVSPSFTPDLEGDYVATLVVDDGRDTSDPATVTIVASIPTVIVSGLVTFDKVGHAANGGLDYTNTVSAPARGVLVEVVDGSQQVVASTATDEQGRYSFELSPDLQVRIRVKARMQKTGIPAWDFPIVDNTSNGALYSIESPSFTTGFDDIVVDLHAPSGWDNTLRIYASPRSAAPFALLDAIYDAVQVILAEEPTTVFPPMDVNWSPSNRKSTEFVPEVGDIITTAYNFDVGIKALFVLGSAGDDTDEYDAHVITHEFAHYLEDRLGRTDSPGGSHSTTSRLDPRLALSEGWANAFSAIALGDPVYKDSMGAAQASGFTFNIESNNVTNEGWYNESSVHSILYDIVDSASDGQDSTAAGFGPLWEGMTGWHADTEALTSLFSLVPELKNRLPADAANIDALLSGQGIEGPTMDIWASTETNDAGRGSDVLPLYAEVIVDEANPVQVCTIDTFGTFNRLSNRRFLLFDVSVSDQYRITVTGPQQSDPDVFLYKQGVLNSAEGFVEAQETLTMPLSPGRHVVEVYNACIVFGSTANPGVCPNNVPSRTCLNVKVERL